MLSACSLNSTLSAQLKIQGGKSLMHSVPLNSDFILLADLLVQWQNASKPFAQRFCFGALMESLLPSHSSSCECVCEALGVYSLRLSVAASTAAMVVLITLFVTVIKIRQPCWCMIRYR